MTFLLGWKDNDGVFLCADSAATRLGAAEGTRSSFGEAQQVDRFAVEERAVKLLELPRGVLVGLCGDVESALDFVMSTRTQLAYTTKPLIEVLRDRAAQGDLGAPFKLLFGHCVDGAPVLTAFDSEDREVDDVPSGALATFGSMPREKKELARRIIGVVSAHRLPPEARLAGTLVSLQAVGITEYLPQHYVGGAFFGAWVTPAGVMWQPDLCYITYPPGMFRDAPIVKNDDDKAIIPSTRAVELIRVLVREGAGILMSSLGDPRGRVLIPPTSSRTDSEWDSIVLGAVPPPFRLLVAGPHIGLLSVRYAKAVYVYNPSSRTGALSIEERDRRTVLAAVPRLVDTLELAAPEDRFMLSIVVEDESGTQAKTYGIALPS